VAASLAARSSSGVWRPRLGITYQYYASVGGAVITAIEAGGPAAQAGLKVGDTITAIQGFAVTGNDSFPAVMRSLAANQAVTLVYIDGSTRQQRQATSSLLWPQ
jgi:S1-C subfamily serine protease